MPGKKNSKKPPKVFCPSCRKTAVPKIRKGSYLMWCGNCGDPLD